MTINTERLTQYDDLHLDRGGHETFDDGHCAMEVVAWLAGEGHTDAPVCASPVLRRYTIALNDRWPDERRQLLKPYLPRMVGTGSDGKDELREQIAARFLVTDLLGPWLRLAGMDEQADALAALTAAQPAEIRAFLYKVRDEAWKRRRASLDELRAKVRERLAERPVAAAVADAAAVAAAAAVADAAADAVAAAVADAAADADAAAVAVAVAAAAAVAVAAAAAAAVAVAVADAAADADAAAAAAAAADAPSWQQYDVAYKAARQCFRDNPLAIGEKVQALAAEQQPLALTLLDKLIDPEDSHA